MKPSFTTEQLVDWSFIVMSGLNPEPMPPAAEAEARAAIAQGPPADVRRGFIQSMKQLAELATDSPPETRARIDAQLAAKQLPTLGEVEAMQRKRGAEIAKTGAIRDQFDREEAQEMLNDLTAQLTPQQRQELGRRADDYDRTHENS
jgi:hypothetical protein